VNEHVAWPNARGTIQHWRAGVLLHEQDVTNVITNSGRDFLHQQGYQTTGLGANGLNYIGLSADALTETVSSTVLSTELSGSGLTRAQGAVNHTASTNTTTVGKTFTMSGAGPQTVQKAALFTASGAGTMCHVLAFSVSRSLILNDQLVVTYTITLG
jgi:hypothetical protein